VFDIDIRIFKQKKSPNQNILIGAFLYKEIGGDLLSHIVAHAVPSALKSLTSVFGMGTGGSSSLLPPIKSVSVYGRGEEQVFNPRTVTDIKNR
jgi:hypothetical protein